MESLPAFFILGAIMPEHDYKINATQVQLSMAAPICRSAREVMQHPLVGRVVAQFLYDLEKHGSPLLQVAIATGIKQEDHWLNKAAERITDVLRLLIDTPCATVAELVPSMGAVVADRRLLADFVERLYNYWRTRERYLLFEATAESSRDRALEGHTPFIHTHEMLQDVIRDAYRRIEASIRGYWPRVYRQVSAGTNMSLLIEDIHWPCPSGPYEMLRDIRMVRLALLEPPVVLYPRRNVRKGKFVEVKENPLQNVSIDPDEWFCMPVKVGSLVMSIFFHEEYLALGTSLVNLFELAGHDEARCKPDGILVFGVPGETLGEEQTVFFEDEVNDLFLGVIGRSAEVDYFGYFKKMILTLHNLIVMRKGRLPFHGAMCHIELKNGTTANVVIVGDSAAGKSESLEAFRVLADEHLRNYVIIADDMGSLDIALDGAVRGYGTEIGAFVRLDDLQAGYAFGQIDRSILMNPQRTNARLVIPVTTLEDVTEGYPVHLFLYANNYEQVEEGHPALQLFNSSERAMHVFGEGYRAAKGTSDEVGLVHTYFGNPFGPMQRREQHDQLAMQYFEAMFAAGVKVGQLRTRLGIPGFEQTGPESAARALFDAIAEMVSKG
jgi:hypothetical protein